MRAYCRRCDKAVDAAGAWPGRCSVCWTPVEEHPVPDLLAPGLRVLFVGINPGVHTARARLHFANPANAFWGALHDAGFTPRRLLPSQNHELLALGLGITNAVSRATPGSADVTPEDVARGGERLHEVARATRPDWLAFVGKEAYKMATGERVVDLGENAPLEGARTFVLPSTSPRNAHWTPAEKIAWFRRLREATLLP